MMRVTLIKMMIIVSLMIVMRTVLISAELGPICDWKDDGQGGYLVCRLEGGQAHIVDRQKVGVGCMCLP